MREAQRLAELGLLTAGLIHELRQPIFALKALLQLVDQCPDRRGDSVAQMLGQVETLERLVAGYGDFSRRPAARAELFDVRVPVESALVVLGHRARAARVTLDSEIGEGRVAKGSALALQQVVVNLGQNAIDAVAGRPGGRVAVRIGCGGGAVTVRIEDNGPGIAPEIRAHLFTPFRTTKPAGTGLGLVISRDLVTAWGGRLALLDTPVGAAWEITLAPMDHG
jgi:two-component system C4-dicarboxylate transport sensor histidine kinase DctB